MNDRYWSPQGHVNEAQRAALTELVAKLQPEHCLEIGFATGRSLSAVYFGCFPKRLLSVDISLDYLSDGRRMAELMQRELAGVTILEVDSHDVNWTEMADQYFDGQGVDFAFIDGDHSEEGCYQDLTDVMWIMSPGGLIVVDDYMSGLPNGVPFESVNRAVHRFVKENSLSLKRWFDNGKGMAIINR